MGRKSDARERLLAAALELIWDHGYGSTTVDEICERAGVRKGSFYYFFDSKCELAAAAIEADWLRNKEELDRIFSPTRPPLRRLHDYFDFVYHQQRNLQKSSRRVLGCPLCTLGSEVCACDPRLGRTIDAILTAYAKYFESAIREAQALGQIEAGNAGLKARCLFSYFQGTLTRARIHNDLTLLKELPAGALEVLRVRKASPSRS
ncbi:MAG: TetR/AcrR family transcriptional regulator [Verrucomicrobiae bacterium]|nr:TetR/AcrR family transcriptional regulator [Verrucomicrobiae bacterium]